MADDHDIRLNYLESKFGKLEEAISSIDKSLQKIVMLEEKHAQTREILTNLVADTKAISERVTKVELVVPQLVETRGWVVCAMKVVVIVIITAVTGVVLV